MAGYSTDELIGMNGLLLIAEKSRPAVMDNILSGYEKPYEAMGLRKNGEAFPITGGCERVLLVDDEEVIVAMERQVLDTERK